MTIVEFPLSREEAVVRALTFAVCFQAEDVLPDALERIEQVLMGSSRLPHPSATQLRQYHENALELLQDEMADERTGIPVLRQIARTVPAEQHEDVLRQVITLIYGKGRPTDADQVLIAGLSEAMGVEDERVMQWADEIKFELTGEAPEEDDGPCEVDVTLLGHGVRVNIDECLSVERDGAGLLLTELNAPAASCRIEVGPAGVHREGDALLALVEPLPSHPESSWTIETYLYGVSWPDGLSLHTAPFDHDWPFELHDRGDGLICIRGGDADEPPPPLRELVAAEQVLVRDEEACVEVVYVLNERGWRQRHRLVELRDGAAVVVSVQAPEGEHETIFDQAEALCSTIRARCEETIFA